MSKVKYNDTGDAPAQEVIRRDSSLRLISSPVATGLDDNHKPSRASSLGLDQSGTPDVENLGFRYRDEHDCPEFIKHSNSTNYELFYDLWFVANLEIFSSSKGVSKESDLYAYIGYLSILWFTWFSVGMFDVRFVTDSLFERIIRTTHLGVMVGFSVVVSYFDPEDQDPSSFQTLSYILMVSRLVLVFQYATIIWHIRKFKHGKTPVAVAAVVHFIAAMIYLGIGFRFQEGKNSRVYIVWYIVAAVETLMQLGLAKFYTVLTFTKTHLTERMTVLTVIILGAGVTSIAKNVALIVTNAAGWTSGTIGVLISAISLVYFFFMIYFDWMSHHHLSGWRQLGFTLLHFPFHVCLLLFMEGATQFMIWWKAQEVETTIDELIIDLANQLSSSDFELTGDYVADQLNLTVSYIFEFYPPTYTLTTDRATTLINDIRSISQDFWENGTETSPEYDNYVSWARELMVTVINSVFTSFKIDPFDGMAENDPEKMQWVAIADLNERYSTVFQYTYVTSGMVLMLMVIMFALTRKQGWTVFVIFRTVLFGLMGLGLSLVELISKNEERSLSYLGTPMLLPTICLVFFVVLLLTHLPHPPPLFFGRSKNSSSSQSSDSKSGAYLSVHVREVNQSGGVLDNQEYDPHRWGTGGIAGSSVHTQDPTPQMTYHNAYGQSGDFGRESPPLKHN